MTQCQSENIKIKHVICVKLGRNLYLLGVNALVIKEKCQNFPIVCEIHVCVIDNENFTLIKSSMPRFVQTCMNILPSCNMHMDLSLTCIIHKCLSCRPIHIFPWCTLCTGVYALYMYNLSTTYSVILIYFVLAYPNRVNK